MTGKAPAISVKGLPYLLGSIAYHLLPVRRHIVDTNLSLAFGNTLPQQERKRLAKAFYGYLLRFPLEVMRNRITSPTKRAEGLVTHHAEINENQLAQGRGLLWLAGHTGNWEVSMVNLLAKYPQYSGRVTLIRKRLRPSLLNSYVMKQYARAGFHVLPPEPSSIKTILKKLRNNEIVMFVLDQHVSTQECAHTTLFDHPVQLARSLARLAIQTQAPVVPVNGWRDESGAHHLKFGAPIANIKPEGGTRDDAVTATTQQYCRALEEFVLEHPDQWFCWAHRLWKAAHVY